MDWHLNMIHFSQRKLSGVLFFLVLLLTVTYLYAKDDVFSHKQIKINSVVVNVEVAETSAQRQQGLMNRAHLKKNQGMIFVFERSQILSFWMKNTKIPLSIGFFDKDHKLVNIRKMHPPESVMVKDAELKKYTSLSPVKYALEMNLGWFEKNHIKTGDRFTWLKPKPAGEKK